MIQGSLIPFVSKKLRMIDNDSDVMKTFSDYTDDIPVQFIQSVISADHPWCNTALKDIILPPDTLIVMLVRGNESLVPNGETVLSCGDTLIISAKTPGNIKGVMLTEKRLATGDRSIGKSISNVANDKNKLIVLILRDSDVVIPNGATILMENDVLVINHKTI